MKKLTLFLIPGIICLVSCQKAVSWDPGTLPGGSIDTLPGNNSGLLLVKTVSVQNNETMTTTYSYTADKKIEIINITGTSGGLSVDNYREILPGCYGKNYSYCNEN